VATLHLADMGADVVKVEDREEGDYLRSVSALLFRLINRNKRAIRLDLKREEGREVLLRLAKEADVLVESFRPGVMAKLGLGYGALAAANPRIVYCSITGYGQNGPYSGRAGHDINYIGYAGVADQIGTPEAPVVPNFQIADLLGGALVPAMGILASLVEARSSGRGRHVDVAMTDAVLAHALLPLSGYLESGHAPERGTGMLDGGLPCYNLYRTRDGRTMAVGALERKFWEALCDILGCPELKGKHIVQAEEARSVKARIGAIFATRTRGEWTEIFAGADCCVSPVLTVEESLANEQLRARGMVVRKEGTMQFAPPFKFSDFDFEVSRPAPKPGEHTDEVLREAGYDRTKIDQLRRNEVVS
jgi:crotonobetainyl-CoA:carnitine CoA-transferase CaiB-like acyl-CoA transferase